MTRFATGARRWLAVALVMCVVGLAVAQPSFGRGADYTKATYEVPVTQPDEYGQPVSIDTDVYLPGGGPASRRYPLIEVFHGGGSDKSNPYDSAHAAFFAEHGYVVVLYSQRGNGNSRGQEAVAGPKEMRDLFDVTAWALGIGGRDQPAHADFGIDPTRIALTGYSQGGLNTNLAQAWSTEPSINPYRIALRVLEPANTPDVTFNALVPDEVVKLSFGVGLVATYLVGTKARMAPIVDKWIATTAPDQPALYGGSLCDATGHDTPTSTMKQDLAARSPGCFIDGMTPPSLWAQAFDDNLFPAAMAISMWQKMPDHADNRLYLSMGGHAAPAAPPVVEQDRLDSQLQFLDHFLRGKVLTAPPVVYWTRDPAVTVSAKSYQYPDNAWYRQTADSWPPAGVKAADYQLGADGRAVVTGAQRGTLALQPASEDERNDPVAAAAMSGTPLGTSPVPSAVPATDAPGFVDSFSTPAFTSDRELSGAPHAQLTWTPASPDTQLVLEVFDRAPDGALTLLSRGVTGLRGAAPGRDHQVVVDGQAYSALVHAGHSIVAWVLDGDPAFYKPYPGSVGGVLHAGPESTLTLPLRPGSSSKR